MTTDTIPTALATESLRGLLGGAVHLPGEPGYDEARMPWNLAVDQRPAAVALPATTDDVVTIVRAAAAAGLRVAPQGTGHNAGPLGSLADVVLLRTSRMRATTVDPVRGRARVQAGALWEDAVAAAAEHGVTVLHGSSPDVGVVGYSLGGGMGWYARALGLQTNSVTGAEVVTADGTVLRVDADRHPELFWALRGGGGNLGIVTELEFRTFPFDTAYAGMLVWDWQKAPTVLDGWARWAVDAPDEVTTSFRLMQLPPLPDIPEPLRGGQFAVVEVAHAGGAAALERVLAPLRALGPVIDTVAPAGPEDLQRLHMDPDGPVPSAGHGTLLAALPDGVLDGLLAVAGPGVDSPLLSLELRHLGGALARVPQAPGALATLEGQFALFAVGITPHAEAAAAVEVAVDAVLAVAAPWAGRAYANFCERRTAPDRFFDAATLGRLQGVRDRYDPDSLFRANHPVTGGPR